MSSDLRSSDGSVMVMQLRDLPGAYLTCQINGSTAHTRTTPTSAPNQGCICSIEASSDQSRLGIQFYFSIGGVSRMVKATYNFTISGTTILHPELQRKKRSFSLSCSDINERSCVLPMQGKPTGQQNYFNNPLISTLFLPPTLTLAFASKRSHLV